MVAEANVWLGYLLTFLTSSYKIAMVGAMVVEMFPNITKLFTDF